MKATTKRRNTPRAIANRKTPAFDVQQFLSSAGVARRVVEYRRSEKIYAQGNGADQVFYIQGGGVRLSVVNEGGKEAVIAMLGPGEFFGEGGLAGQPVRMATATAITGTTLLAIDKTEMARMLHAQRRVAHQPVTPQRRPARLNDSLTPLSTDDTAIRQPSPLCMGCETDLAENQQTRRVVI
jgi:CRP-like cAMP-binding protein